MVKNVMDVVSLLPTQLVAFIFCAADLIETAVSSPTQSLKRLWARERRRKKTLRD
jgi:hypothetical protein